MRNQRRSIAIALLLLGCGRSPDTPPLIPVATPPNVDPQPRVLTPPAKTVPMADVKMLTAGNTAFAFDLYARLLEHRQFFVSPYSISTDLAMLYAGARGQTAEEIAKVCRFRAPPDELAEVYANLIWRQLGERKSTTDESPKGVGYQKKDGKLAPCRRRETS